MLKDKSFSINFYKKGNLTWLIDTTDSKKYCMETRKELLAKDPDFIDISYETRLAIVNSNPKYKYNNWRLPTIEELKTLEYRGYWFNRIFKSKEHMKNDISINKDIFYDIKDDTDVCFWARDKDAIIKDGKKRFASVGFTNKRFKIDYWASGSSNGRGGAGLAGFPSLHSKGGEGLIIDYDRPTLEKDIRLVRDIKNEDGY